MQLSNKLCIDFGLQLGIVTKSVFPALQLLSARELSSCLHCDPGDCSCSGGVRDVVQLRVEMGRRGSH